MPESALDLDAYLHRLGGVEPREASLELLGDLHAAHLAHIPFENVDVVLGRGVDLDLDAIQRKMVLRRRGGYCFEHNLLFSAVLRGLGFDVTDLAARVRPPGATRVLSRSHMLLEVALGGEAWLADVGFGGNGPTRPVPMDGTAIQEPGVAYRVGRDGHEHVLRARTGGDTWVDLYSFTLEPAHPADYEQANHFTSTHPRSPFVRGLTVQLSTPSIRHVLRGRSYTRQVGGTREEAELDEEAFHDLLASTFGLELDGDEREGLTALVFRGGRPA